MATSVGVIGAGELGQALGHVLEKTGLTVAYYDTQDDRSTVATIAEIVASCGVILLCVPSWANRQVAHEIAKHSKPQEPPLVISLSKGVEPHCITMDKVLRDSLPTSMPFGLIYGPMLANELVGHRMGAGVLALSDADYSGTVRDMFARARVFLEVSADMPGVALSGVLKNVYAIAFGMNDGLKLGANARGRLMVQALREMKRLLQANGANPETAEGLAGLGDVVATGTAESSFNYRVGRSIAEGIADEHVKSEGLTALKELSHIVKLEEYPLARLLNEIVYHYGDPHGLQRFLEI